MTTPVKKVPIHLQSAQNRLLIKGGTVINDNGRAQVDVYVEDSLIKQIGNHLIIPGGTRIVDATGKYVMPGGIDCNVHFQMPISIEGACNVSQSATRTIDDFYQGTKAAVAGGTTMVIDCVIPDKNESLVEAYHKWRGWADEKVCCDYGLRMAIRQPVDDHIVQEMKELTSADLGINTFWFNLEEKGHLSDADLMGAFEACAMLGCLAQVHPVNGDIVERNARSLISKGINGPEGFYMAHSEAAEEEAVMRASTLASQVNCPLYFTSLTTRASVDIVQTKKSRGHVLFGETSPASIACDAREYWNECWKHAAAFVCSPPIRQDQCELLLQSALSGGLDTVASNHATFNSSQKALGVNDFTKIPPGVNGVESRMCVLWQKAVVPGKITPEQFVALTSVTPAKLFNVYPDKGKIAVGCQADIVIWDPAAIRTISAKTHNLKTDFNIFEGLECRGAPETVIVQGRIVVDEGQLRALQGFGKFVALPTFSSHIFDKVREREAAARSVDAGLIRPILRPSLPSDANGADIPCPEQPKSDQPEKAPSQQESSFNLTDHPNAPENGHGGSNSNFAGPRFAIRVRAPPGGRASGNFW